MRKKGFRYLVDKIQLSNDCTSYGLREIKIIEISEIAIKVMDMISLKVWWVLNEWQFEIIEELNDELWHKKQ